MQLADLMHYFALKLSNLQGTLKELKGQETRCGSGQCEESQGKR